MSVPIKLPIHLIGIGCGGSKTARYIADKGPSFVSELHAWDGDVVESHNVGPQWYTNEHVGMKKVDALALQVKALGGIELVRHGEHIDGPREMSGIAIVIPDSMDSRWNIWEHVIRKNERIGLMIEVRLEARNAYIFVLDPNNSTHIERWEKNWYPDDTSTTQGMSCGTETSLGPIADLAANLCVWQMIRYALKHRLDNEIRCYMMPLRIETRRW